MKRKSYNNYWIIFAIVLFIFIIWLLKSCTFEGLDNPDAATVKCMDKGLKCNKESPCCEGLKCLGDECK
jgi:hypothetical protein